MRLRMVILVCLLVWSGIALSGAGHPAKSEVLMNDTGLVAYGLRVTFDKPVSVTGKGEAFTRWVTQEDGAVLLFGEGEVGVWGDFYFYWEPEDAIILSYEWLSQPPNFEAERLSQSVIGDSRFRGVNIYLGLFDDHAGNIHILAEDWNANLVRVCLNATRGKVDFLIDESDPHHLKSEDLAKLDHFIDLCENYGIRVIIDLHEFLGFQSPGISGESDTRLWESFRFHEYLISFWRQLAEHYANRGDVVYGYDLLNEPNPERQVSGTPSDWNLLVKKITKAIREVDTEHAIIVESIDYAHPDTFTELVPTGDANTIYSFHFYYPHQFTHQGCHGNPSGVSYPGIIGGEYWDKNLLRTELSYVVDFQKQYQVPILVGEFGTTSLVSMTSRCRYLKDCIDLFEEYGFDWCYAGFRICGRWSLEYAPPRASCDLPREYVGETKALALFKEYLARNVRETTKGPVVELPQGIFDESHWKLHTGENCSSRELAWLASSFCRSSRIIDGPISDEILRGASLLILGTPEIPLKSQEISAITKFVSDGGGLLIFGDIGSPLLINDLSSIFGITFDTVPILSEISQRKDKFWVNHFNEEHWISTGVEEFQVKRSGSLQMIPPAVPLLVTGEDTWKDDNHNERCDVAETRGPFVIAAAAEYGNGRVFAIADSTFYSDTNFFLISKAILWLLSE